LFVEFASTRDLAASLEGETGVVRATIQTVEDIYQLIWTAIASKRPIEAVYKGCLGCFVPIDWYEIAGASFECCVTSMVEKAKADWKYRDLRQTGVAQRWRRSAG
jgi:hypothetical protein